MLCENCQKREATYHVTQTINGHKTEKHLCGQCAQEKQNKGQSYSIFEMLQNDFFKNMMDFGNIGYKEERCEHCGMSYYDFNQRGKFGCAQCYTQFKDQVTPLIQRLQGSVIYEGKLPEKRKNAMKKNSEIKKLRDELDRAIKAEEFEKAVSLRDMIKALEADVQPSQEAK